MVTSVPYLRRRIAVRNRHCLGGYRADTFKITVLLTATAGRWSFKELPRRRR